MATPKVWSNIKGPYGPSWTHMKCPPAYLSNPDADQHSTDDAQHWSFTEEKYIEVKEIRYRLRCYVHQESLREGFLCYTAVPPYRKESDHPLGGWHCITPQPVPWDLAKEVIAEDAAKRIVQAQEKEHKKREALLASLREINRHLFHGA